MTGMRSHTDHQSRLDWWRRQIQRQPKTHLTTADFGRQLGVGVPTFYYWKRRVQTGLRPPPEPVVEASRSRPPITATAPFLPVSIVDPDAGTHLEIELANTCVVRLGGPLSPRLLRAAIEAAGQLDGSRQAGHCCCPKSPPPYASSSGYCPNSASPQRLPTATGVVPAAGSVLSVAPGGVAAGAPVGLGVVLPGTAGPWVGPGRTSWASWVCCSGVPPVRTRLIRAQPEGSSGETDWIAKPGSWS